MSEKLPLAPKPKREFPTQEEMNQDPVAVYFMANPPTIEIVQDSPEICAEKIAEAEALFISFEETHDLEALRAITQFSSREERLASIRQQAIEALAPFTPLLNYLRDQKAVPREIYDAFKERHKVLSRAVGTVVGDVNGPKLEIVVHDR